MATLRIRRAGVNDLESILELFVDTILTINARDYSAEQTKAWANGAKKTERWLKKITEQYFLIAEINSEPAGFASITTNGYLDFLFVSKDHQRKGIAQNLYNELEKFAYENHFIKISSDVSATARPFFLKQGFTLKLEQQVVIEGIMVTNYKMEKRLVF